jgi:pimeloyl-ACP methyl ester carboxylesterase
MPFFSIERSTLRGERMKPHVTSALRCILIIATLSGAFGSAIAQSGRTRDIVKFDDVVIDLIAEGSGPLIVMLPSRGRDSEDFDEVAAGLARDGFRVLRPQPRGAGASRGPIENIRMQDLARDIARIIEREKAGPAVIAGHAYGNWVARMTATDHPALVRGIVLIAAAAKTFPSELRTVVQQAGDAKLSDAMRLQALQRGFFLAGHDASVWLKGWAPDANRAQGIAATATAQAEYWQGGNVPMLDLVPDSDPFKPKEKWYESREEFGDRVTVTIIQNASHALIPEQPQSVAKAIAAWVRKL